METEETFRDALAGFRMSLTEKQRTEFRTCSLRDVEDTIHRIQTPLAATRSQRNMQKISGFLEGMEQLGKVVEVFLNVDNTVAFIWAPIKFLLLTASTWVETLDCLLDTYSEIGDILPGLTQYGQLLDKHPFIRVHLEKYYCAVLRFHRRALDVFSRPRWKVFFHSSWKTFRSKFGSTLRDLKKYRDLLSDEKITATILEVHKLRQSMEDKLSELSRQVQDFQLEDEDSAAIRRQEELDKRRRFVLERLDGPDTTTELEKASGERRGTHSGEWILGDAAFQEWLNFSKPESRMLHLHGSPGTGKTILASWIVEHLRQTQVKCHQTGSHVSVVYFFFKHSLPEKNSGTSLLLSLISQLVFQDEVVLDVVYKKCLSVDQQKIRSTTLLRELATTAFLSQRLCFIVIDGLDECIGGSTASQEESQGEVIDLLESIMAHGEPQDSVERCVRLLICSQRNGYLEERLPHCPQIQLELNHAHIKDIEVYCKVQSLLLQKRFSTFMKEDTRGELVNRVCFGAKGMFLYAKIVLGNLLCQPSLGHLKRELKNENFPKGLDQAYERVVVHILDNTNEVERNIANSILGWLICAERSLLWKEVQSLFCIKVEEVTADPDFRLTDSCKHFCGSLVEVGGGLGLTPGPDGKVELVHETARIYLIQSGRFSLGVENYKAARFCLQYLSSRPFILGLTESDIDNYFKTGYYGFLDYATSNWWKHAKKVIESPSQDQVTVSAVLVSILSLKWGFVLKLSQSARSEGSTKELELIRDKIQQLSDDGRKWEDAFPIGVRTQLIRMRIETLVTDEAVLKLEGIRDLYGHWGYKCPKPWCHFFVSGFATPVKRDRHLSEHDRPFRCDVHGCYGQQIGFPTEPDLDKHNTRLHSGDAEVLKDFPAFESTAVPDIIRAAAKGNLGRVQELVTAGVNVNIPKKDKEGTFPLYVAAKNGHLEVCRYLLNNGAAVNAQCKHSRKTALHAAVSNDDTETAFLLISEYGAGEFTNLRDSSGQSSVGLAFKKGCKEIIAIFPPETHQHRLCKTDHCFVVTNSDPAAPRRKKKYHPTSSLMEAIQTRDIPQAKCLIATRCVDMNYHSARRYYNGLPLHKALTNNKLEIVHEILQTGRVDLNRADPDGNLPVHLACRYITSESVIRDLVSKTHPITAKDIDGATVISCLLQNTGFRKDFLDRLVQLVSFILETANDLDLNEPDDQGHLPLHYACRDCPIGVVELVLAKTNTITTNDNQGETLISSLLQNEHVVQQHSNRLTALVSLVLETINSLGLNEPDDRGCLPLHHACKYGPTGVVELVLDKTRLTDKRDDIGYTPLHYAVQRQADDALRTVEALLKSGSVNILNVDKKFEESIAITASRLYGSLRNELLELLFLRNAIIAPQITASGVTALHFGAWSLNPDIVRKSILENAATVNTSAGTLPEAWEENMRFKTAEVSCPIAKGLLLTPLFLALNTKLVSTAENKKSVVQALLEVDTLDLSRNLERMAAEHFKTIDSIVCTVAKMSLWPLVVARGFSFPWSLMAFKSEEAIRTEEKWRMRNAIAPDQEHIIITNPEPERGGPKEGTADRNQILAVIRRRQCKFLTILKANFNLAFRIIQWSELSRGSVDLTGEEEIIAEVYDKGTSTDLRRLIELGIDGDRALLDATHAGRPGLVEMLLAAGAGDSNFFGKEETWITAYNIAILEGHTDVADRLWVAMHTSEGADKSQTPTGTEP